MSRANIPSRYSGFTLVEMLIIAPIALIVITGFIALMVTMVGDALVSRSQNAMTYDVQSAINTIERDVRLSTEFLTTTSTLPSPQGKNGATSAFTSTSGDLILGEIATDKNPIDPARRFVYYNTPNSCTSDNVYQNRIFFTTVIYTIRDGSLWRRTYVPTPNGTLCQPAWQINTCAPGYSSSATRCKANDSEILKNVKTFTVEYFINPEDTVPVSSAAATTASSLRVTIETEQSSAGRTVGATSSGRATKLSSQEINLAPPDAPVVTGSNSGTDAIFSWASVPTASSYIIKYNINGGGWKTASENSTETTFSLPAYHGDTVSVQVASRNTTGASAAASASTTIPLWLDCPLENGWVNYGAPYPTCGYTVTKAGVVVLKGLVTNPTRGSNSMIFRLPKHLTPSHRLLFAAQSAVNNPVRLQVQELDSVYVIESSGTSGWLSLSGITFIPGKTGYNWTNLSLQNGWQNYSAVHGNPQIWAPLSALQDSLGRMHLRGLIIPGTETAGTVIANLPGGSAPSPNSLLVPALSSTTPGNTYYINAGGFISSRGLPSGGFLSVQNMYHPASYSGIQNFTVVTGSPGNGQIGNGWESYWTPKYVKASDNIVSLHGLIKGGTNGTVAMLPPGYRPAERHIFNTVTVSGVARIDVLPTGLVTIQSGANATWTALDGVTFVAEQ